MKRNLLIIGAGGQGKVVADIAKRMNQWEEIAFLDDNEKIKSVLGYKVIGKTSEYNKYLKEFDVFVGIGNNDIRHMFHKELENKFASIPTLIHPSTIIGENVEIGKGTVIMPGVIINSSTKIGKGCIINTGSIIDHDNEIGDFVHISPGVRLAGSVEIGNKSWLGIGSVVINNINIAEESVIGAGAVVISHITEKGTYVGVPAKRIDN